MEKSMHPQKESTVKKILFSSEMAKEVRLDFYRSIEEWIGRELEAHPDNLTGLAILLSDEILHLTRAAPEILSQCPRLVEGLRKAFSFSCKKFEEIDSKLDQHHVAFQKDLEDLDFRVVRQKEVFLNYLRDLAHSEEFYFVSRRLKKIYDVLSEIMDTKG